MNIVRCVAAAGIVALLSSCACRTPSDLSPVPQEIADWLGDSSRRYPEATPATEWSPAKNILWSVSIGANMFSSEIIVDGKILLVAEPSMLVCVDAATGTILWKRHNDFSDLPEKVEKTPAQGDPGNTTPTPVSDGQFVYASFGCGIVACYDLRGQRKWITHIKGKPPQYGRSASPVVVGDKLLVSIGNLTALDTKTGKEIWKAEAVKETYGTPAKARIGAVDAVVTPTGEIVRTSDGAVLASTDGRLLYVSPIVHDGVVYFINASSVALQLPDKATDTLPVKNLWECSLEGEFFASPVYANGLLFTVGGQGKLFIVDAQDGKILVSKDLPFESRDAPVYSSPTVAGKYVFVSNVAGETLVIEAAREYKEVKLNRLPDGSGGTPVFKGRRMFIRGGRKLYCIGEK